LKKLGAKKVSAAANLPIATVLKYYEHHLQRNDTRDKHAAPYVA
jgi:hypothetical protein